jgi:hypothetical protein
MIQVEKNASKALTSKAKTIKLVKESPLKIKQKVDPKQLKF